MRPDTFGVLEDIRDAAQYIVDDTAGMTSMLESQIAESSRLEMVIRENLRVLGFGD